MGDTTVRAPDGRIGTLPKEQVARAVEAGAKVLTDKEVDAARQEEKYGGLANAVGAGAAGFARGLTFGASDQAAISAARGFGDSTTESNLRERLNAYRDLHPLASTGGEVAGALAPLAFSGGAAAPLEAAELARLGETGLGVARGASRLARAGEVANEARVAGEAAQGGRAAVSAFAPAVRELPSFASRAVTSVPRMAAEGAVIGGLQGGGGEISEAALGDTELTAEKVMAGVGHGAFVGGLTGGALGLVGELGTSALNRTVKAATEAATGGVEAEAGGIRGALGRLAEKKAFKALGPTIEDERTVEKLVAGGKGKIGRDVLEHLPEAMGKPLGTASVEDIALGAEKVKNQAGDKIGSLIEEADARGSSVKLRPTELLGRIDSQVLKPLEAKVGYQPIAQGVRSYVEELQAKLGAKESIGFGELQAIRKDLDGLVFRAKGAAGNPSILPSMPIEELRHVRSVMENYLMDTGEAAAKEMGGSWGAKYKDAKSLYQSMSHAERISGNQILRGERNATFGLRDTISAAGALASGHPLAGIATGMASKYLREHGNQIGADLLHRASKLGQVERIAQQVDGRISGSVKGFFEASPAPQVLSRALEVGTTRADMQRRYAERVASTTYLAAHPDEATKNITASLGDMTTHAPQLAQAMVAQSVRANAFLLSKIPPQLTANPLMPHLKQAPPSDAAAAKFLRYEDAVDHPEKAMHDFATGKLSSEQAEVLRAVYPKMFDDIRKQVIDEVAGLTKEPPYAKTLQLRMLFGVAVDPTTTPQFQKALQATFVPQPAEPDSPAPQEGKPPAKPYDVASQSETASQKLEGA